MNPSDSERAKQRPTPDADLLVAALCYLMTRFTVRPCPGIAQAIVNHLDSILAHPKVADLPERSEVYRGLLREWQGILESQTVPHGKVKQLHKAMH